MLSAVTSLWETQAMEPEEIEALIEATRRRAAEMQAVAQETKRLVERSLQLEARLNTRISDLLPPERPPWPPAPNHPQTHEADGHHD
jgi:hypothetical protein